VVPLVDFRREGLQFSVACFSLLLLLQTVAVAVAVPKRAVDPLYECHVVHYPNLPKASFVFEAPWRPLESRSFLVDITFSIARFRVLQTRQ